MHWVMEVRVAMPRTIHVHVLLHIYTLVIYLNEPQVACGQGYLVFGVGGSG